MTELPKPCITCGVVKPMNRSEIREYILHMVARAYGWSDIADRLNNAKVPTLSGGSNWYASTVKSIYEKAEVKPRGGDRWSAL